jgi:iron complex outermembrane receptor protein
MDLKWIRFAEKHTTFFCFLAGLALAFAVSPLEAFAQETNGTDLDLPSLEQLMSAEVTSVAKKEQTLSATPAGVYVVSSEDIAASGERNIPDLLRIVPGLQVAQMDENKWAVSARGFNGWWNNKLLVLVDGRSVYTTLFSGVFWDQIDLPLDEIDRIEVIRGPGAALWGTNAVNGVVNIISKKAQNTHGNLLTAGAGSHEPGSVGVRTGGEIKSNLDYRFSGNYGDHQGLMPAPSFDSSNFQQQAGAGFRLDWGLRNGTLVAIGNILRGSSGGLRSNIDNIERGAVSVEKGTTETTGTDLLLRWTHETSSGEAFTLQASHAWLDRASKQLSYRVHTVDVSLEHRFRWGLRNEFVWGAANRTTTDKVVGGAGLSFVPVHDLYHMSSVFLQDDATLVPHRLAVTIGAKIERDSHRNPDLMSTARVLWTPSRSQSLWAAVSQAERVPSRTDRGLEFRSPPLPDADGVNIIVEAHGSPSIVSEEVLSAEIGYRMQQRRFSFDVAAFHNFYDNLRTSEPGQPFITTTAGSTNLILPSTFGNKASAETYGAEISTHVVLTPRWKLTANYALLRIQIHRVEGGLDPQVELDEGRTPRHQVGFRSSFDIGRGLKLIPSTYYVGALSKVAVPSYVRLDLHLSWQLQENVALSLMGQNLLRARHLEFADQVSASVEQRRNVFGQISWRF